MHSVLGIKDHDTAQTNANVFSGMPVHDILDNGKQPQGKTSEVDNDEADGNGDASSQE